MATTEQAEPVHVIVHGTGAGFAQEVEIGSHELYADEPVAYSGTDTGPTPYDLLLAALEHDVPQVVVGLRLSRVDLVHQRRNAPRKRRRIASRPREDRRAQRSRACEGVI